MVALGVRGTTLQLLNRSTKTSFVQHWSKKKVSWMTDLVQTEIFCHIWVQDYKTWVELQAQNSVLLSKPWSEVTDLLWLKLFDSNCSMHREAVKKQMSSKYICFSRSKSSKHCSLEHKRLNLSFITLGPGNFYRNSSEPCFCQNKLLTVTNISNWTACMRDRVSGQQLHYNYFIIMQNYSKLQQNLV